ncbi:hypothetical protein BMS3Abin08_02333 [bacterium BMS3Abin08]|nr:hypothetical protein BMS3Abin08_02333 [bacterium BMS3Abin08]
MANDRMNFNFTNKRYIVIFTCLSLFCFLGVSTSSGNDGYLGMSLPANFKAFSRSSPWNTPIPENPEIDPFSGWMIEYLKKKAGSLVGNIRKWTIPVHVIDSERSPKVDVKSSNGYLYHTVDPDEDGIAEGLPIPEGVWSDPERDGHMVLVDPGKRKSWEFAPAKKMRDGTWIAGNIDVWDLDGPGFRRAFSGKYWWTIGATSSGLPLIGGLIRPEEIQAGEIKHALLFAAPVNRKTTYPGGKPQVCLPGARTDGTGIGFQYIPLGARMQLDPAIDLDSLNLSPASRIVARAMQKYGMFNVMTTHRDFVVYFQNLGSDGGIWKRYNLFDDLKNIPIESFRVLKCRIVTEP